MFGVAVMCAVRVWLWSLCVVFGMCACGYVLCLRCVGVGGVCCVWCGCYVGSVWMWVCVVFGVDVTWAVCVCVAGGGVAWL